MTEKLDDETEMDIGVLESSALSASNACEDCTHSTCIRARFGLDNARAALRDRVRELSNEARKEEANEIHAWYRENR